MFEFTFQLGLAGLAVLVVGALIFGIVAQLIGERTLGYEWVVTAMGAGIGAFIASEFIVTWQAFAPVFDGLALIPALIGGFVLGIVVAVATRLLTGGHYFARTAA